MNQNPDVVEVNERVEGVCCAFCHRDTIDALMWGPMYQLEGITVHYFCLLFAAGMSQNGEDHQGILGFLPTDIKKELSRGKKLKCKFCKNPMAAVGCSVKTCKMSFHYPCGLENGCLFQFIDNFESYCKGHRKSLIIKLPPEVWTCPICYCGFDGEEYPIKPPCCSDKNNSVYHRRCMMEAAFNSALHFFKCPLCNNKEEFSTAMRKQGIFVPDRDASWELDRNAFAELQAQYNKCDAMPECLCPRGRSFNSEDNENKDWKVVRCGGCGASGIHMKCGNLENLTFRCEMCSPVLLDYHSEDSEEEGGTGNRRNRQRNQDCYDSDSGDEDPVNIISSLPQRLLGISDSDSSDSDDTSSDNEEKEQPQPHSSGNRKGRLKREERRQGAIKYKAMGAKGDSSSSEEEDTDSDYDDVIRDDENIVGRREPEDEESGRDFDVSSQVVRTGLVQRSQNSSPNSAINPIVPNQALGSDLSSRISTIPPPPPTLTAEDMAAIKIVEKLFQFKLLERINQPQGDEAEIGADPPATSPTTEEVPLVRESLSLVPFHQSESGPTREEVISFVQSEIATLTTIEKIVPDKSVVTAATSTSVDSPILAQDSLSSTIRGNELQEEPESFGKATTNDDTFSASTPQHEMAMDDDECVILDEDVPSTSSRSNLRPALPPAPVLNIGNNDDDDEIRIENIKFATQFGKVKLHPSSRLNDSSGMDWKPLATCYSSLSSTSVVSRVTRSRRQGILAQSNKRSDNQNNNKKPSNSNIGSDSTPEIEIVTLDDDDDDPSLPQQRFLSIASSLPRPEPHPHSLQLQESLVVILSDDDDDNAPSTSGETDMTSQPNRDDIQLNNSGGSGAKRVRDMSPSAAENRSRSIPCPLSKKPRAIVDRSPPSAAENRPRSIPCPLSKKPRAIVDRS